VKEVSDVTACVVDTSGYFLPLARQLSHTYKRVLFNNPTWQKGSPIYNEATIGDGFDDVEWCEDFWLKKDEVDLFIFPDLNRLGEQHELKSQGFPVWCAYNGMKLETNRQFFLNQLESLGLDVPAYDVVTGITDLREYLYDKEDIYIKMSKWRGSWETKCWHSWKQDSHKLDYWAVKFGGKREKMKFLCFPKIDTKLEIGGDTYTIDGDWPDLMLHGIEKKDEAYFSAVTKREDMPEELTHIMDAFSPLLKESESRTQWSMEVRVTDKESFFIDPTMRGGLPSTASQLCALSNLDEVMWHGSHGVMIQPEYKYKFTAECMVRIKGDPGCWETIIIDKKLEPWLKLSDCCAVDGQIWFPADDEPIEEIGWLCSVGDTPTECAKHMNELSDLLPDGAEAAVESLSDIIREVEEEQKQGIHFTDQKMPEPQVVLEPT
jgi:hypothetical protein